MTEPVHNKSIAIVILGNGSLDTAKKIQALYPQSLIYGLQTRVDSADKFYAEFGETLRDLYRDDNAIIALCAAGIVIRTLAPLLTSKGVEPPVLAIAEDGSAVVPLLGGLGGVNVMAREIAAVLQVLPAITTSGELRFGTCLLNPPAGYVLADIEQGKRFVSDLLSGQSVRVEGGAEWLGEANLTLDKSAQHVIRVTENIQRDHENTLLIHPRNVLVVVDSSTSNNSETIVTDVRRALSEANIAELSLACFLVSRSAMGDVIFQAAANALNIPLRFFGNAEEIAFEKNLAAQSGSATLYVSTQPIDVESLGQSRGRLTVIGLGPGATEFMVPAAKSALRTAQDILGYETYVNMAGPFRADQVLHCTDNREEMQRARHAFELAAQGRDVVVVSSGDPGVFAMAAAVLEALHESDNALWHAVDLQIFPGVSAALATAARSGAPLGHDFCVMSLSDNLKPWAIIEKRLDHAAAADFALAFYNPISKARPWQLARALEIVAQHRRGETVVVLGRDIGRPAEALIVTTLAQLTPEQVDMRTLVIIGSSLTRTFPRNGRGNNSENSSGGWVYTPRWYS